MTGKTQHEELILERYGDITRNRENRAANADVAFIESLTFNGDGLAAGFEDFGDGWTHTVRAPTGFKGKVVGVSVYDVTETFNSVTTEARVEVGTSADADAYYLGGDLGDPSAAAPANVAGTFVDYIPGGADFLVTGVAPTGGTPAGRGTTNVVIAWIKELT